MITPAAWEFNPVAVPSTAIALRMIKLAVGSLRKGASSFSQSVSLIPGLCGISLQI